MSLVGSATSYGNRKLYALNGSNDSGLSTSIFNSDKHKITYTSDSYSMESFDPKYFIDSPSEELVHSSSSSIQGNKFHAQAASSYELMAAQNRFSPSFVAMRDCDAYTSNFESAYLESHSPEATSFDEEKMRLKLQELERALLEDNNNDEDDVFGPDQHMEIDGEWGDPVHNVLLHDSPKESSSSDSNISSISSSKETSLVTRHTPRQLLFECLLLAVSELA
ncbi:hypothetical protein RJ639_037148 [Escallonia herrerae]|uniref:Uncharacterized protein n=1 Tax=Escallonia herrerae TaxID=1293975 RepID=A0AA88WQT6_9ASTE|nr:hypothetical protein RJ639_037148 [Escallonia herrerae]